MFAAYKEFNSTVGIYTMDHSGTGRSHFLQCQAAQVDTDGSESSVGVTAAEMAACLHDLNFQPPRISRSYFKGFFPTTTSLSRGSATVRQSSSGSCSFSHRL
jgi:hypothetical protein